MIAAGFLPAMAQDTPSSSGLVLPGAQIEIRASWTPVHPEGVELTPDTTPHVEAWGELMCTAAGLPPVPEGVAVMPSRRGQRGR